MIGQQLGPYIIEAELGSGGMGTVYRATGPDGTVALKVVHPHLLDSPGFFKRFLREAEIGRCVDHPNVVRTLDCDAIGGHHFLVMEFVEGQTLRDLLAELGRAPEELCRHIGREVTAGLDAIHATGAVHRDLKPENVLITPDHEVKIMDLGVARLADAAIRLSISGAFVGSVLYAAPEQFKAEEADRRADFYSLGLILYELATGRLPGQADDFAAVMLARIDQAPRPASELNPQLSPYFEEVLKALLECDPASRLCRIPGEDSTWWRKRARAIQAETKRPLRRVRIPRETALYGRADELAKLRTLYDLAKSRDGQVVLIEGEAGIGKTRLVDEFVGGLQQEGEDLNFLFGSYPPGGAATAAGAFTTAYREQFGEEGCAPYVTETRLLIPAFDALLRGGPPPEKSPGLTKEGLQSVFLQATRTLAAERPTIVLIDDLHFAPTEGHALFAALALGVAEHRVLLLGTARRGLPGEWASAIERQDHAQRMSLSRLGPKDLAHLLEDAFQSRQLAGSLAYKIGLKSDGNPFFVFEIIRGLREGKYITRRDDGTWATTRVIDEVTIPSSIQDLIQARILDLPEEDKDLLDVAACYGFEFDPLLIAEVMVRPRIEILRRLARIEMGERLVRANGASFVFDHHQIQETLYASQPELLRREYHAEIARVLRERLGDRSPDDVEGAEALLLCTHQLEAGQLQEAAQFVLPALGHLEGQRLVEACIELGRRALDRPGMLSGWPRLKVLHHVANLLNLEGRQEEEASAIEEVKRVANEMGDPATGAHARRSEGYFLMRIGRSARALEVLLEARELASAADDTRQLANANALIGMARHSLGRLSEAEQDFWTALDLYREIDDALGIGMFSGNLGYVKLHRGKFREAMKLLRYDSRTSQQVGNLFSASNAEESMSWCWLALGDLARAVSSCRRGLWLARETAGFRVGQARQQGWLGALHALLGDPQASERLSRESADLLARPGTDAGYRADNRAAAAALEWRGATEEARTAWAGLLAKWQHDRLWDAKVAMCALIRLEEEMDARELLDYGRDTDIPSFVMHAQLQMGGDVAGTLLRDGRRIPVLERLWAHKVLWERTSDRRQLDEAHRILRVMQQHAPEEYRASMIENVPLHSDIMRAWEEHGGDH